ncbi:Sapep family Mn(2+)-dependent dipeptidase [Lachnotalea sp. AF33-28]|uniref:Sapep family Mn(2+)-dependent dipeptidase n=1 Tax=Lachnotalea sp. AF33-28 TaxID=2292046 RepID=UPI000E46C785|nr:Sapep family Mn(2+)-dependent dipeptidase [Lachnotalea sp. AF33-28]RHP29925.1 M20/M25/M40 family metallo-hydrolase [Lachnotalea sp. AF33-28]
MDQVLYKKISCWMDEHVDEMTRDIVRLVKIPSISDPDSDIKPFGPGCRAALEEMLKIGNEYGFKTKNYENYVGALWLDDGSPENTVGMWNHLDVVPAGDNWEYGPFEGVIKDGYIIGRGAQDNKGPAVGMLYLMRCLKELNITTKYRLCLFVGCDEERGMSDLEYYCAHYETPAMSIIADSGFPVCYGEKGILEGRMISLKTLSGEVVELTGGTAGNIIPDKAVAVLKGDRAARRAKTLPEGFEVHTEAGLTTITAHGISAHSAFPKGGQNAIQRLIKGLLSEKVLSEEDSHILQPFAEANQDYYGEAAGISYEDEVSGKLTCAGTVLRVKEGHVQLIFNIRYPVTDSEEQIQRGLELFCGRHGCRWERTGGSGPSYFPKEHPAVDLLTGVYNEIMGLETKPFVMGGGTYAKKLPSAFAYGVGGMPKTEEEKNCHLFQPQHGGAHQPDEGLNIASLAKALKIYAMSMIALDGIDLDRMQAQIKL